VPNGSPNHYRRHVPPSLPLERQNVSGILSPMQATSSFVAAEPAFI
jgi:hypothetical protein